MLTGFYNQAVERKPWGKNHEFPQRGGGDTLKGNCAYLSFHIQLAKFSFSL